MIRLGSLGRPILRHVYVCPGADVDEYSYASLYTYLIYHFPLKRLPLTLSSSLANRGHVYRSDKSNN